MQTKDPADPAVQAQVQKLQVFITEHYYTCTKEILHSLGQMYGAGGEFTANIDAAGGPGAAEFARKPSSDTAAGEFQTCPLYPAAICASINSRSQ